MKDGRCPTCGRGLNRTSEQNARMWAMLRDISEQVIWYDHRLTPEEWKIVLSSSLRKQKVVPGTDGGFVALGVSTSQLTRQEMSDLMELISAFGASRGVVFGDDHVPVAQTA